MSRATTFAVVASSLVAHIAAQVYTDAAGTAYTVTQDTGASIALASKVFDYPYLPYQADSGTGDRGTQQGYNICNDTTLGAGSWCQTGFVNNPEDFCLWGSPTANETVGDVEEEMVAYCTIPTYGTRMIPPGALTGLQFVQTPDYIEIAGFIDQTVLNLQASDFGGEEDPHGDDQRGNPLGSLLYTSAFGKGPSSDYIQVHEWSYFIGGGVFCFKLCDPSKANAPEMCQHIYDRIGCTYNDPVNYDEINGTFASCKGDDMSTPGVYVTNGVTTTYTEPPESLGPITTVPYTPTIISTSECSTYESSSLYTAMAAYAASASPSSTTTSLIATSTSTSTTLAKGRSTTSASEASATTKSTAKAQVAAADSSSKSSSTSGATTTFSLSRAAVMALLAFFVARLSNLA